jgi:hypothetical protein
MSESPIARRVLEGMRRHVRSKLVDLAAIRAGNAHAQALQQSVVTPKKLKGSHPAFALYAHVQNQMSVMAEQLLALKETQAFAKLIGEAEEEYMPSWPPMSPITTSYFWGWSTLDLTVNAHRETLGLVVLRVATEFGVHPTMLALMRTFNDSRMGVYRVEGLTDAGVRLMDLATGQRCAAICESGYPGNLGELWFTRVLPPMLPGHAQHVVFTSPYVLLAPDETAWNLYFERIAAKDPKRPRIEVLGRHFKGGPSRRYWPEFVFEGYVNHRPGAIYLKGLPDVAASRPHSKEYVHHGAQG